MLDTVKRQVIFVTLETGTTETLAMRRPPRQYRIAMTVPENIMQTVFELLSGEATDFQCKEVHQDQMVPVQMPASRQIAGPVTIDQHVDNHFARRRGWTPTAEQRENWAMKHWPIFEGILKVSPNQTCVYNDPRLGQALENMNVNPSNVSPLWTVYHRAGKVDRIARGLYKLRVS